MFGLLKTAVKIGAVVAGTGLVLGLISRAEKEADTKKAEAAPEDEAH